MTKYIVQGGHPLFGEVRISGAKNAAVAIIPAALLVDGVCRIENIPQISDVTALLKILEQLGANVRFLNRSSVEIDCRHISTTQVSQELAPPTISLARCSAASARRRSPCPAAATLAVFARLTSTSRVLLPWALRYARATLSAPRPKAGA